jgi:hypothetical protein
MPTVTVDPEETTRSEELAAVDPTARSSVAVDWPFLGNASTATANAEGQHLNWKNAQ